MAAPMSLRPTMLVHGSAKSSFTGNITAAFQKLSVVPSSVGRTAKLQIEASRVCDLTGTKANNGYVVTFSHKRNKKLQQANLQYKKIYWPEGQRWVKLRVCTRALKTVEKKGLQRMADEAGIDLWKLPFEDARPQRREWLAANPHNPPMAKNARKMKNPEKLAASKKTPLVARYSYGKIEYVRADAL